MMIFWLKKSGIKFQKPPWGISAAHPRLRPRPHFRAGSLHTFPDTARQNCRGENISRQKATLNFFSIDSAALATIGFKGCNFEGVCTISEIKFQVSWCAFTAKIKGQETKFFGNPKLPKRIFFPSIFPIVAFPPFPPCLFDTKQRHETKSKGNR